MWKSAGEKEGWKLGDYSLDLPKFPQLQERLKAFETPEFLQRSEKRKTEDLHKFLLNLIQEFPAPCFLLAAVGDFILLVNEKKILTSYSLSKFELWLNLFSGLSFEENYFVRAKIMGKYLPREAYQSLFPIGMGKVHFGSHYVTAHNSPDLDTTIASFWGWVDAFAARVSEGLHIWNVPDGPPASQVEIRFLFHDLFGVKCFDHFAKTRSALALSALDLIAKGDMSKKTEKDSVQALSSEKSSVVLVDPQGYYLGELRPLDVEEVRKVTMLFNGCMRWFASNFQKHLTLLFSEETISQEKISAFIEKMFSFHLGETEPAKELTETQKKLIELYLVRIFGVQKGLKSSFAELWDSMKILSLSGFEEFEDALNTFSSSDLFDERGLFIEHRPRLFQKVEKLIISLEKAIQHLRIYVDQLGISLKIKEEVVGFPAQPVSSRAEIEEIRSKMGSSSYVVVATSDSNDKLLPLGVIRASEVGRPVLGTVSLRDFCNREETKIPAYFEVISVVDHHKSSLTTSSASTVFIADSQSANALVAELAFSINDRYSLSGATSSEIQQQIQEVQGHLKDSSAYRVLQKLLQKRIVAEHLKGYFVDPKREYLEYLQCLYAILDDTDLLSKVSYRDVICLVSLLNRMKTLVSGKETEIISLDDLPLNEQFVPAAAKRILQHPEMYSLYKKVYEAKEKSIEDQLSLSFKGEPSTVFADTKVQNGCCRVGQTKLFSKNFAFYAKSAHELQTRWYLNAKLFYEENSECDLHMHMLSTIPGAEDVYAGREEKHSHLDELWIWIPIQEQAVEHLKRFLNAFRFSPQVSKNEMEVEFLGENAKEFEKIFKESFSSVKRTQTTTQKKSLPIAILRYKAGLLNSRKAMISPYLPKLLD